MDEQVSERADVTRYWELAANAGWSRSEAASLLETAAVVGASMGTSAEPVDVALAWLGAPAQPR